MRTVRCSGCLLGGGVCPGGVCPGGCLPRGVSAGGVSVGSCIPACTEADTPLWTEWPTDRCKNTTFPQLRLRTVIIFIRRCILLPERNTTQCKFDSNYSEYSKEACAAQRNHQFAFTCLINLNLLHMHQHVQRAEQLNTMSKVSKLLMIHVR